MSTIRSAGGKADFVQADLRDAASARGVARRAAEIGAPGRRRAGVAKA